MVEWFQCLSGGRDYYYVIVLKEPRHYGARLKYLLTKLSRVFILLNGTICVAVLIRISYQPSSPCIVFDAMRLSLSALVLPLYYFLAMQSGADIWH